MIKIIGFITTLGDDNYCQGFTLELIKFNFGYIIYSEYLFETKIIINE
jgi:hypothetical protein